MDSISDRTEDNSASSRLVPIAGLCLLALAFWFLMFSPWTSGKFNFWAELATASGVLACSALWIQRRKLGSLLSFRGVYVAIGILAAGVLYAIFYLGHLGATVLLPGAGVRIAAIYATRAQASPWVIALLLLLVIGPAEELFWRNFVQRELSSRLSSVAAWLLTAGIYSLVHVWALNLLLLGAALVCGLFWGAMFMRYRSVWPGLISHALWDMAAFVLFPFK